MDISPRNTHTHTHIHFVYPFICVHGWTFELLPPFGWGGGVNLQIALLQSWICLFFFLSFFFITALTGSFGFTTPTSKLFRFPNHLWNLKRARFWDLMLFFSSRVQFHVLSASSCGHRASRMMDCNGLESRLPSVMCEHMHRWWCLNQLPEENWVGWGPEVSLSATRPRVHLTVERSCCDLRRTPPRSSASLFTSLPV